MIAAGTTNIQKNSNVVPTPMPIFPTGPAEVKRERQALVILMNKFVICSFPHSQDPDDCDKIEL